MSYIAAYFALRVVDMAIMGRATRSTRQAELCRVAGIDPDETPDPKQMIAEAAFFNLLERVAREDESGRTIGIRVGSSMCCSDYGAFGLAFKTARDLWGSFQRVERFGKVVTSIANYTVCPGDRTALMAVNPGTHRRLGQYLTNELAVAAATALCREVSQVPFTPTVVHFSHKPPPSPALHEAYFRCPIHYESDRDGLEISNDLLHAGNRLGDEAVSAFFDSHLEIELAERVNENNVERRVRNQITQALSAGVPKITEVASQLGMSGRTLQRRLAEKHLVYQVLVDETRRDLAVKLLQRNEFGLAEIAFLTGYAEQSTFTRAFKRWHGRTPGDFRRRFNSSGS